MINLSFKEEVPAVFRRDLFYVYSFKGKPEVILSPALD